MKVRPWIAWKLVQLAHRVHNAEFSQTITIQPPTPGALVIEIIGDAYGCGISSTSGIRWQLDPADARHMRATVGDWIFRWDDDDDQLPGG